jgi:RNase H-fold protein (predicted Holliday junction resolvase)
MLRAQSLAGRTFAQQVAYTDVYCCVCVPSYRNAAVQLGFAKSDPYLSTATALGTIVGHSPSRLARKLSNMLSRSNVGSLFFALPHQCANTRRTQALRWRRGVARALMRQPDLSSLWRRVQFVAWDGRRWHDNNSHGRAAWREQGSNEQGSNEQWVDARALSKPWASDASASASSRMLRSEPGLQAEVALQSALDQEMGGCALCRRTSNASPSKCLGSKGEIATLPRSRCLACDRAKHVWMRASHMRYVMRKSSRGDSCALVARASARVTSKTMRSIGR